VFILLKKNKSFKPNYHFFPITGWCNDPNGLIEWGGKYHLFYQYNPKNPEWGPMHWGHAISEDLIHWKHLPVALYPERIAEDDISGIFSGSAVDDSGVMKLMYTSFFDPKYYPNNVREVQCIASSEDGMNFEKFENNPVIAKPPLEGLNGFRDPKVWKDKDGKWKVVIGSGFDKKGMIFLYSSDNLINWKYEGVLFEIEENLGRMIECPDFFYLGEKSVLIFSVNEPEKQVQGVFYCIGNIQNKRFIPERMEKVDFGTDYYAAQTFMNKEGRRIIIAWMQHPTNEHIPTQKEGWAGIMTLPREIVLSHDRLFFKPIKELEQLRRESLCSLKEVPIDSEENLTLGKVQKNSFEVLGELEIFSKEASLLLYNEASESVKVNFKDEEVLIDTTKAGIGKGGKSSVKIGKRKRIMFRLFIDSSSMELFLNNEKVGSYRIYPCFIYNKIRFSGKLKVNSFEIYSLENIWI